MKLFQTITNEAKTARWQEFCERMAAGTSLKLFWRLHKMMNCPTKSRGIPNLQDVDLTWKRTDEDNGTAMLTNYLGKIGQRNVDEYVGIHRTTLVFCSFCGSYFISAHIYQREFHRSGYYHLRGSVSHLQSTQCLCFYGSVWWEYDQGV